MKYINILFIIFFLFSCSSGQESILSSKKGLINFLEGKVQILIPESHKNRIQPYIFNIFRESMPDVEFEFVNEYIQTDQVIFTEILVHNRYTDTSRRNYDYDKCVDFNFKKFKCVEYRYTVMYCKTNLYKSDVGINIYQNGSLIYQDRALLISEDENCSESTPSPISLDQLAINNDYYLSEWIVGKIAESMLNKP